MQKTFQKITVGMIVTLLFDVTLLTAAVGAETHSAHLYPPVLAYLWEKPAKPKEKWLSPRREKDEWYKQRQQRKYRQVR